jgi:hypothetical protein
MKRAIAMLLALVLVPLSAATGARAQELSRRDRLFLFYNYSANVRNNKRMLENQTRIERNLRDVYRLQTGVRRLHAPDRTEEFIRMGATRRRLTKPIELPPLYSGQGGERRVYFQRNPYFNPVQGLR